MRLSLAVILFASLGGLLAAAPAAGEEAVPDIAGIYEMDGETTVEGAPDRFHVAGKLVIRQNGARCRINVDGTFRRVAGESGPAGVALIGTGEALLRGKTFSGSAELQTILSEVPGVDVKAAYMPKKFGPKMAAVADGKVLEEGVLLLEIRSTLRGEGFTLPEGRKTIVRAKRVARSATELKKPQKK